MWQIFKSRRNSKSVVIFAGVVLTAIAVSGIAARSWYAPSSVPSSMRPASAQPTPPESMQVEQVTATPRGFEPLQLTRPSGKFLLNINNRSELKSVTLLLLDEQGERVRQKQLPIGKLSWAEVIDLPPGRYTLTEAEHREWTCELTINSH